MANSGLMYTAGIVAKTQLHLPPRFCRMLLFMLIILFQTFSGRAQVRVLTLEEVLQQIETNNPMLRQYDSRVKAKDMYATGATAWMAPMVGVGPYWYPYPGQNLMSESEKGMFMINVEQDIPNPAKQKAKRQYFAAQSTIVQAEKDTQLNTLRALAKANYFKWLVENEKLKRLQEGEEILTLMLKLARLRYPYNQGSLADIYKAEGRLYELENMRLMSTGAIAESSARLKSLMNFQATDSLMIDTTTVVAFDRSMLAPDTAALTTSRADIRLLEQNIAAMRLNQNIQRQQAKPDFRFRFEHMSPRGEGMPKQFSIMAMISIPIAPWSSKMYRTEVKGMQYDIESMQQEQVAIANETKGMLVGMARQLQQMQQQLTQYQTKIIPALSKSYGAVMVAYEENRESLPMVVDAWETMNMAYMAFLDKKNEYYQMIVKYEQETNK